MAKMETKLPTDLIRRFDAITAEHVEMFEWATTWPALSARFPSR